MTCPALIRDLEFSSNITGRKYFAIDINNIAEIKCKLQNYIYLLTCTGCGIQYVGESITPLNKRMNIHRKGKSGCEIAINHYRNICKNASFRIQILEKLPGNGYKNGAMDLEMLEYRLQREDYWIKTLRTSYPYGLNERTRSMNKNIPVEKIFHPYQDMENDF